MAATTACAAVGLRRRLSGRAPRAGGGALPAGPRRRHRRAGGADRTPPPGQQRSLGPVRAAVGLCRRRQRTRRHRRRTPGPRTPCRRGLECRSRRLARRRAAFPAAAPATRVERRRRPLDGLGAQARQDRTTGLAAGRAVDATVRLCRPGWALEARRRHAVHRGAGRRHAAAAGQPAFAGVDRRTPGEPAARGPEEQPRGRRPRRVAAACGAAAAHTGHVDAVPCVDGRLQRTRPLLVGGVRGLRRPVRRRQLQRQGAAARAGRAHRARRPAAAGPGAQPRPARRCAAALRVGRRRGLARRRSGAPRRGRFARAPLDAWRLATAAFHRAAPSLVGDTAEPVEDARQPAPIAGGAGLRGFAAGQCGQRLARAGRGVDAGAGGAGRGAADRRDGRVRARRRPAGAAPAGPARGGGAAACDRFGGLAVRAVAVAVGAAARCDCARAVPPLRQPPAPAGVDHGGCGRSRGFARLGGTVAAPSAHQLRCGGPRGLSDRDARAGLAGGAGAVPAVGPVAAVDLGRRAAAEGAGAARLARSGAGRSARHRPRDLALLRPPRHSRDAPPAARQPPARAAPADGHRHVAHQHRHVPAGVVVRVALRFHRPARRRAAHRRDAGHVGDAAAAPRPLLQLDRHAHAGGAAAGLRVHRGQRQPVRSAGRGGAGFAPDGGVDASRGRRALRGGRSRAGAQRRAPGCRAGPRPAGRPGNPDGRTDPPAARARCRRGVAARVAAGAVDRAPAAGGLRRRNHARRCAAAAAGKRVVAAGRPPGDAAVAGAGRGG